MTNIKHEEYIKALKVCNDYLKQIKTDIKSVSSEKTIQDLLQYEKDKISQRLQNVLNKCINKGFVYVSELNEQQLLSIPSCGRTSVKEFLNLIKTI